MSNPKKDALDALTVLYSVQGLNVIVKNNIEKTIASIQNCIIPVIQGEERETLVYVKEALNAMISDLSKADYHKTKQLLVNLQECYGLCNRLLQEEL